MIYTITLNPAKDITLYVTSLDDKTSYVTEKYEDPAGKGINVSKTLYSLSVNSTIVTVLAGETGKFIHEKLSDNHDMIFEIVPGTTRTNTKLMDQSNGNVFEINETGPSYDISTVFKLVERLDITSDDIFILSGSTPLSISKTIYKELIKKFKDFGAYVVLDASGQLLIEGVKGYPNLIKPNKVELEQLMETQYSSVEEIFQDRERILSMGADEVLVSLGELGSIYISKDKTYVMKRLNVDVKSTVGAGDSLLSGYIYGMYKGYTVDKRLKVATAVASASVETHSTSVPDNKRVVELCEKVDIKQI